MILNKFGKIVEEELIRTKEIRKNIDLDYYIATRRVTHLPDERAIQRIAPTRTGKE